MAEQWEIKGSYVANCNCANICPCPVGETPHSKDGQCRGVAVWHIDDGHLGNVDLSGVNWALYNHFPGKLTDGNWKVGLVVDEGASDDQARALERIVSGQEGGAFADLATLISDYAGLQRARVAYSDGDKPTASVLGMTEEYAFEALRGATGEVTTVKNAMFGFSPEYRIGTAGTHSEAFDITFDGNYAEAAEFEFSSEGAEVKGRA